MWPCSIMSTAADLPRSTNSERAPDEDGIPGSGRAAPAWAGCWGSVTAFYCLTAQSMTFGHTSYAPVWYHFPS